MWKQTPIIYSTPFPWNLLVLHPHDNLQIFNEKVWDGGNDKALDKME